MENQNFYDMTYRVIGHAEVPAKTELSIKFQVQKGSIKDVLLYNADCIMMLKITYRIQLISKYHSLNPIFLW